MCLICHQANCLVWESTCADCFSVRKCLTTRPGAGKCLFVPDSWMQPINDSWGFADGACCHQPPCTLQMNSLKWACIFLSGEHKSALVGSGWEGSGCCPLAPRQHRSRFLTAEYVFFAMCWTDTLHPHRSRGICKQIQEAARIKWLLFSFLMLFSEIFWKPKHLLTFLKTRRSHMHLQQDLNLGPPYLTVWMSLFKRLCRIVIVIPVSTESPPVLSMIHSP